MSGFTAPDLHPLVACLGWTLINFVWQGATIALFFAVVMRIMAQSSAAARHLVALGFLVLSGLVPLATFFMLLGTGEAPLEAPSGPGVSWWPALAADLSWLLPWAVAGWFLGVVGLSGRLALDWMAVTRLVREGTRPLSREMDALAERVLNAYAVRAPVRVLESALVGVPVAVGWLKPIILVPPAALMGLSTYQLELILAHEAAHIRRYDHLINLYQVIIETLLFYHPAVRWISNRVRLEREHCCDDLVAARCGDSVAYARALAELEGLRCTSPSLALAATDGALLERVRRLVARQQPQRGAIALTVSLLLVLLNVAIVGGARLGVQQPEQPSYGPVLTAQPAAEGTVSQPRRATLEPIHVRTARDPQSPPDAIASRSASAVFPLSLSAGPRGTARPEAIPTPVEEATPPAATVPSASDEAPAEAGPDIIREADADETSAARLTEQRAPETPGQPGTPPASLADPPAPDTALLAVAPDVEELLDEVWRSWPHAPETPTEGEPVEVYTGGELLRGQPPRFPREAKMLPDGGWVVARFTVNRRGRVEGLTIIESRPQGVFDRAVTRAVSKWRFRPFELEGVRVERIITQAFEFEPDPRLQAKGGDQQPCKIVTGSRLCRTRFAEPWERGVEVIYQARRP